MCSGTTRGRRSTAVSAEKPASPPRLRRRFLRRRRSGGEATGAWYPRWYWPTFSLPGVLWMVALFALPFYVVLASAICLVIAYAVAYYVARFGGKRKGLFLTLLIAPFFISYLMRMLSWVELLQPNGYVNSVLTFLHITPHPINWLAGVPFTVVLGLVYGYIPYMILPLYGFLDRIDQSQVEAGRDLGANPFWTFVRVTLPLSKPAILASLVIVTLPMFGDYYTNNLLSGSPKTTMFGNLLDNSMEATGQGPEAAILVLFLAVFLMIPMLYYMRQTAKAQRHQ